MLVTIGRGWAHGDVTQPITFKVTATGAQLTGVPYALGLAGLAGALALFAVRRIGRYLVGAVLALAGAGTVYAVADRLSSLDQALHTQAGVQGLGSDTKISNIDNNLWPYLDDPRRRAAMPGRDLHAGPRADLVRARQPLRGPGRAAGRGAAKPVSEVTARDLWDAQGRGTDLTETRDHAPTSRECVSTRPPGCRSRRGMGENGSSHTFDL